MKPAQRLVAPGVLRLRSLRRLVRSLEASVAFYRHGLGFRVIGDIGSTAKTPGIVMLALGDERIELVAAHTGVCWPEPADGPDTRFQHVAVVASDMDRAYGQLQSVAPVPISRGGPQRLPAASGGVRAFKFRDPDGHPLELIEFPAGSGDQRWQAAKTRRRAGPTLGIDHSAISVSDVERSVAYYQQLGFTVGARQRNSGAEQARLDGLDSSEVEVVALLPVDRSGPHLELLGYQTPQPISVPVGKPGVGAQVTRDRLVWQLAEPQAPGLVAVPPDAAHATPRALSAPVAGAHVGLLVDPDGHLHELVPAPPAPHPAGGIDD